MKTSVVMVRAGLVLTILPAAPFARFSRPDPAPPPGAIFSAAVLPCRPLCVDAAVTVGDIKCRLICIGRHLNSHNRSAAVARCGQGGCRMGERPRNPWTTRTLS
jgi:hypothetical protein